MENLSPVSFIFQQVMNDPIGFLKTIWRKLYFYFNSRGKWQAALLETPAKEGEYLSIQKRLQFYSQQMRMKSLPKQIFGLSGEQNRHLYKIYRNMKVELG